MADFAAEIDSAVEAFVNEYNSITTKKENDIAYARTNYAGGTRAEAEHRANDTFHASFEALAARSKDRIGAIADSAQKKLGAVAAKPMDQSALSGIQALRMRSSVSQAELAAANASYGSNYQAHAILCEMGLATPPIARSIAEGIQGADGGQDGLEWGYEALRDGMERLRDKALFAVSFSGDPSGIAFAVRGAAVSNVAEALSPKIQAFLTAFDA